MRYQKLDLVQGTPEWIETRRKHVTASQVPVIFNVSPYQKASELLKEKLTGIEKPVSDFQNILYARGHEAEAAAREWIRIELKLNPEPAVLISSETPDLLASLDGFDERANIIFEAKYMGEKALEEVRQGIIKPHHMYQMQAQLYVTGADRCIYFAMSESGEAAIKEIKADSAMQSEIVGRVNEFVTDLNEFRRILGKWTPERKRKAKK